MTFLEKIFSYKILEINRSLVDVKEVLFQPNKTTKQIKEHYPSNLKFVVYGYKDFYIGKLTVEYVANEFFGEDANCATSKLTYLTDTVEVKLVDKWKYNLPAFNKVYREAVKLFSKKNKEKGFKSCLLENFSLDQHSYGSKYTLDYEVNTKVKEDYKAVMGKRIKK